MSVGWSSVAGMDHFSTSPRHPLLVCADEIEAALKSVRGLAAGFMPVLAKEEALVRLSTLGGQLEGVRMQVIAAADDLAEATACRTVADWLAPRIRADRAHAARAQRLAQALDDRWTQAGAGVLEGRVSIEQAQVIVRALDDLGSGVSRDVLVRAEAHLVDQAAHFTPAELRRLGEKILEVIAPDVYEEEERKALERAQRAANRATRLTLSRRGDGSTDLRARIPDAIADRVQTYLDAYTSPRHQTTTGGTTGGAAGGDAEGLDPRFRDPATGARLPQHRLLGEAFCSLMEAIDPDRLPRHGGAATTVVVTIDYDALHTGLGVATLAGGGRITAGEARRLACNAGLIPAVLGSHSEVLDLGRQQRLFTTAQKRALALRHPHCRAQGCTVPSTWCEAHHLTPWSHGGPTDLTNAKLLCPWHHHRAHDDRYHLNHLPNGDIRFHKRT